MNDSKSHPRCQTEAGHVCQKPSGRTCIEDGCTHAAGTLWGPYWCPTCDEARLNRISAGFADIEQRLARD
jgi:hypothetical protein